MSPKNFKDGRLELDGLALADPEALNTNLFASDRIVADISSADILKKRFSIDSLVFENASAGLARESEGKTTGKVTSPALGLSFRLTPRGRGRGSAAGEGCMACQFR